MPDLATDLLHLDADILVLRDYKVRRCHEAAGKPLVGMGRSNLIDMSPHTIDIRAYFDWRHEES